MGISADAERASTFYFREKTGTPNSDKNSQQTRNTRELPQLDK